MGFQNIDPEKRLTITTRNPMLYCITGIDLTPGREWWYAHMELNEQIYGELAAERELTLERAKVYFNTALDESLLPWYSVRFPGALLQFGLLE